MTTHELDVLDRTVEKTYLWIYGVAAQLHTEDKHRAYLALRAVLHQLRDRLPLEVLAHLSAQLPMLMRGLLFEGWMPSRTPGRLHRREFLESVRREALLDSDDDAEASVKAVMAVLWEHLPEGTLEHVGEVLPADLQPLIH